jgi:hypothetical protein
MPGKLSLEPLEKANGTDPTVNVREMLDAAINRTDDLHNAAIKRLDDLRAAETRRVDDLQAAESKRVSEEAKLRADYAKQLSEAESKRIDAIRTVDVAAVAVASERATQQAGVLATQVAASAETLRTLVATTAAAATQQLTQTFGQLSDRIAALEKSQYEGVGKGRVSDPAMAELAAEVKILREAKSLATGNAAGQAIVWGIVAVVLTIIIGVSGVAVALLLRPH